MSRVLEALKTLESRQQVGTGLALGAAYHDPASQTVRATIPLAAELPVVRHKGALRETEGQRTCLLPTAAVVERRYLDLAQRISGQLAESGCRVLLFVGPDHHAAQRFSLVQLAQAFLLEPSGDVLIIDGELCCGRLSQASGVIGPGMSEVMLGMAAWAEVIHRTGTARIDFAPCGASEVPSFDPAEFGWEALRSEYRTVLVGVCDMHEPQTAWLAARSDATYFVVSRQHNQRQATAAALEKLRASGASVLGCVVIDD